eukprot:UN27182
MHTILYKWYFDNNDGNGQTYICPAGDFTGTVIDCQPCSDMSDVEGVVDNSCIECADATSASCSAIAENSCAEGYSEPYDSGNCQGNDCSADVPTCEGCGSECDTMVSGDTCVQTCDLHYADNNNENGQEYTCPNGVWAGTTIECTLSDCSETVPFGDGYGSECDNLNSGETCTQTCLTGWTDNNSGNGQDYSCLTATFEGTLIECTANDCSSTIPPGDGFGTECDDMK